MGWWKVEGGGIEGERAHLALVVLEGSLLAHRAQVEELEQVVA